MKMLLSGDEAIALGCYEYGVHFACAYPGTPSTEILETIARHAKGVHAQWAPNEKVAMETGIGASLAGARTIVAMKHVGVNVAADPLMTFAYTGVNGGFILVSADDPGMHSSQNEQDNRRYAKFAKIPMLEPSDSQEAHDMVKDALEISEKFDTPILLRITTRVAHGKSVVEYENTRAEIPVKGYTRNWKKFTMMPLNAKVQHRAIIERLENLRSFSEETPLNRIESGSGDIGIITNGISYNYAREVFPEAPILKLGFSYPMPHQKMKDFAASVKTVIVIEELEPFIEEELRFIGITNIIGKEIIPIEDELNPSIIRNNLIKAGIIDGSVTELKPEQAIPRPPVLCPGCPHRPVFATLNKLKAEVFGDIGCYTLGALPPTNSLHTCIDMGASIPMASGVALNDNPKNPVVAVIGDSTFLHSGITGLMDAVYNKAKFTVLILDNSITAMTGGQQNPSTQKTLMGEDTFKVDIEALCKSIGVKHFTKIDNNDWKLTYDTIKAATQSDELQVIMTTRPCRLYPKKLKDPVYQINSEVCIGCQACIRTGCPALYSTTKLTAKGKAITAIDESLCTGCALCAQVCPVDAISIKE